MTDDWIEKEKCEICGMPAKHFLFASFVCDRDDCIQSARERRGGPGGHQAKKWALDEKKD